MPGDFAKEDFTQEELAALGEAPPEKEQQAPESREQSEVIPAQQQETTEQPETEQAAQQPESAPEESQEKVDPVQKRIDKLTWEKNEQDRKLTLLKQLGRGKYYELYPDEKPEDWQPRQAPPQQPQNTAPAQPDVTRMVVRGGDYDGYTLGDLLGSDNPQEKAAGTVLLNNFYREQERAATAAETKQRSYREAAQREQDAFESSLAREMFGKDQGFTPEEAGQVRAKSKDVIAWMLQTDPQTGRNRTGYTMQDAYWIMNRSGELEKAKTAAAKAAVEKLTQPGIKSIGSGDGAGKPTGYEAMLGMTEAQLATRIDAMTEPEFKKFLKEAPKALRDKHPGVF